MKVWFLLVVGIMLCQTSLAQLLPADTASCVRPTSQVASCFDTRLPVRLCIAEIDIAMKDISTWEQCVAAQMQERHNRERKALVERAAERRASLLQSIVLMSR